MPDDCGLYPPIDTLPQIAQERAIGSSRGCSNRRRGRSGPSGAVLYHAPGRSPTDHARTERGRPAVPDDRLPGQALATRRAVTDIVRTVTLGSYGVVDLGGSALSRWVGSLSGRPPGIHVSLAAGQIAIDLRLRVAHGV